MKFTPLLGLGRTVRSRRQGVGNALFELLRATKTITPTTTTTLTNDYFRFDVVTDGAAATRTLTFPAAGEYIGQEILVFLKTRTHASDVIAFTLTNLVKEDNSTQPGSFTLGAANKFALLRWTGTKWHVIYKDATAYT